MYIHLGNDKVVSDSEVIGVFDIENTSVSKNTKDFLSSSEKKGNIINVSYEMPKTFIITKKKDKNTTVYISQISAATLKKRGIELL